MWNLFSNGFLLTPAVFVSCETISRRDEINMMLSLQTQREHLSKLLKRGFLCSQIIF